MRSVNAIRAAKVSYILLSGLMCLLGLGMMLRPGISVLAACRMTGAVLLAFGIVKLVGYWSKDLYRLAFQFDLAFGGLLIVMGAIMLFRPASGITGVCVALGIQLIADALFKAQTAVDAKRFGLDKWWLILAAAIMATAVGFALAIHPSESARVLMTLFGVALLAEGLLNMCVALCAVKIIRNQKPDETETEVHWLRGGAR